VLGLHVPLAPRALGADPVGRHAVKNRVLPVEVEVAASCRLDEEEAGGTTGLALAGGSEES
jgi:hypothetical protein